MNRSILYLIFSINAVFCFSQAPDIEWQNTIGGNNTDELYSIEQTTDGGYILGGYSKSPISGDKTETFVGNYDYWVLKLDSLGIIEWQNTIGGTGEDVLFIEQTTDGGYVLGGSSKSDISGDKIESNRGGSDYWVIKLNTFGSIVWQKTIGGSLDDKLYSIDEAEDGGFILGGYSYSGISGDKTEENKGGTDYWVIKIDSVGNIVWQKSIGGSANDVLFSVQATSDVGYILFGSSVSGISGDKTEPSILSPFETNTDDYWVVKLDNSGNIEWQNTIGGNSTDAAGNIEQTLDGGYILGGYSTSGISGDKTEPLIGTSDFWVIKLNSSGVIQWQNTLGGTGDDGSITNYISITSDKGYIVGGNSASGISGDKTEASYGYQDYWIVKLDSAGNIEWDKTLGGSDWDRLKCVKETSDTGYILGGWSHSDISGVKTENSIGDVDYWVIKLEESCIPFVFFEDADGDGYGNNLSTISTCISPPGYVSDNTDCNDANSLINPDETEICNDVDDNCNFIIDEGLPLFTYYLDTDFDGYGNISSSITTCSDIAPAGYVIDTTDCDDVNPAINPGMSEVCNGIDDECNGMTDDGLIFNVYYQDFDGDGYGNPFASIITCLELPFGYVTDSTDCDDANNLIQEPILYYADFDGDLYGDSLNLGLFCTIFPPDGYTTNNLDCNDLNILINPASNEICNNLDDNCNSEIDEDLSIFTFFIDSDSDNYGNPLMDTTSCLFEIPGYVSDSSDCNDANPDINPGATEILNNQDDDCDAVIDEGLVSIQNINSPEFIIYPNPNDGNFILSILNVNSQEVNVDIYNLIGQNIYSNKISPNNNLNINLHNSVSGVAEVIISGDNVLMNKLILITK